MGVLWLPGSTAKSQRASTVLGRSFVAGKEIFGEATDRTARERLWEQVPVGQALSLLSGMLRDLDVSDASPQAVERGWTSDFTGDAAARIQAAVGAGRRLLPPQVLLVAIKEALRYCPAGLASDDFSGREVVLRAVWGIADDLSQARELGAVTWGGLPVPVISEFMASQYFNVVSHPLPMIARTQAMWRDGWASSVPAKVKQRAHGQPANLFLEATGCEMDAFLGAAVHLWVQAQQRGFLRFPAEFFRRTGIEPKAVDRFLAATAAPLADLREYAASHDPIERPWDFNELRRHPIVRLDDDTIQVLRPGFVLERAFGQVPEVDVRRHLDKIDGEPKGQMTRGGREEAFRDCLNKQFEHTVGSTMERIFPAAGRLKRLYTEDAMWGAWWKNKKKPKPSVCDWVVDCGSVWICLDANNRRLTQTVAGGFTDPAHLDNDLNAVLATKKASQMASTIKLLTNQLPALAHRNMPAGTTFVPLIVIPDDGLPWNFAVHDRVQELLKTSGTLQSERVTPLGVVTLYDLGYIEQATEDGHDAGDLLTAWRSRAPGLPLQHFLDAQRIPLRRPRWETETFDQLTDDLLRQMTREATAREAS